MKRLIILICFILFIVSSAIAQNNIAITLENNSEKEIKTKQQLESLLKEYNVSKWTFTKKVMIDEKAIPHSHPILTVHTRHLDNDLHLLSTYLHEQLHWFEEANQEQREAAIKELERLYPDAPDKFPEGANGKYSTYLHLIVCYSEYEAMKELVGENKALEVMQYWSNDHYKWVYKTILSDSKKIRAIVEKHKLLI